MVAPTESIYSATRVLQRLTSKRSTSPVRSIMTSRQSALWTYHWLTWLYVALLLLSQLSCVFWDSSVRYDSVVLGQPPSDGLHALSKDLIDPAPYADRVLVCVLDGGRQYQPLQLSRALTRTWSTTAESPTVISGYRVVRRAEEINLSDEALAHYTGVCDLVASTLDAIVDSCSALGYNVTTDYVRMVDGLQDGASIKGVTDSLPLLLEPVGDNSLTARYILPGHSGSACIVRLLGKYESPTTASAPLLLRGVSRSIREGKTLEFLNISTSGDWKNGWYEAQDGSSKWHADLISTPSATHETYGLESRIFDTGANTELPVDSPTQMLTERTWGGVASGSDTILWFLSISISNGEGVGICRLEKSESHAVRSAYDLETFVVNISIAWLLVRWAVCMITTQRGYWRGQTCLWQPMGLGGSVACMRSFQLFPLVLLVRVKRSLAAFWTVGCVFRGEQRVVSEAWFVIYQAITELVLLHSSLLNLVAKMLRRRVSDSLFGPTLAFFSLLHLVRDFAFPTPLPTLVSSSELSNMSLLHVWTEGLRLNGNIKWLFYVKVVVSAINWLPLIVSSDTCKAIHSRSLASSGARLEQALAVRVANLSGLGKSTLYLPELQRAAEANKPSRTVVTAYEFVRAGYVVLGGRYVLSIKDWSLLVLLILWRRASFPPNIRVVVFAIQSPVETTSSATIALQPQLWRLNDPRLQALDLGDINAFCFR